MSIYRSPPPLLPLLDGGGFTRWSIAAGRDLDEGRELKLAVGERRRPHVDLLAVLPLQHQPGDEALAGLEPVHMGIALRQELDPADRADIIGLLHRIDELVAVEAASALDRLGDDVDVVIGGVAAIR